MTVSADDRGRGGERIDDGFFRGLYRSGQERVYVGIRQVRHRKGGVARVMRNDIAGGQREHKISAAVSRR